MTKRAAIYVRVSSEKQGEGVSPDAQEADCRAHCEQKGYTIAEVYRDTEKYRVGTRLVEPSGTRADRPGLRAMLAAARVGHFDVIVAWREDRLYRSYRPMLDVLDTLDEADIDIELVKETFDKRIAPVKAWAAKMELDAKHDRFMMGVAGRLESGKAWMSTPPYGYQWADGDLVHNEVEAPWIVHLWRAYADNVPINDIRKQLINMGAQQRRATKRTWWRGNLYKLLNYEFYYTGVMKITWNGKTYDIQIPPLIDAETARRVQERRDKHQKYPAGNLGKNALAAGLVYCHACNMRMKVELSGKKPYQYVYYRCRHYQHSGVLVDGCCRYFRAKYLDEELWRRVWDWFGAPGKLEKAIQDHVARLQAQEEVAEKDIARIAKDLSELSIERQKVITIYRKGVISEEDLAGQLLGLDGQIKTLQRELTEAQLLTGNRAARLLELANIFRSEIQAGFDGLCAIPQNDAEAQRQFEARRQLIEMIVWRIEVLADKSMLVHVHLEFALELLRYQSDTNVLEYLPDVNPKATWTQDNNALYISAMHAQRLYNNNRWPNPIVIRITHAQVKGN